MMTKQAELKKQAYESPLKSRALSVLIYLIDRSNKELTCFPAIPTMAKQLHISVSTVKRALHELLESGYITKNARFRDNNRGQTSNLYTLVLFEVQAASDKKTNNISERPSECKEIVEGLQKSTEEQGKYHVEHISFDILQKQNEENKKVQEESVQETGRKEHQENVPKSCGERTGCISDSDAEQISLAEKSVCISMVERRCNKRKSGLLISVIRKSKIFIRLWMGEGVNLMSP